MRELTAYIVFILLLTFYLSSRTDVFSSREEMWKILALNALGGSFGGLMGSLAHTTLIKSIPGVYGPSTAGGYYGY